MAGVVEMGKSHTINKENLFKNRGGNRGGTDRGGPRPPGSLGLASSNCFLSPSFAIGLLFLVWLRDSFSCMWLYAALSL